MHRILPNLLRITLPKFLKAHNPFRHSKLSDAEKSWSFVTVTLSTFCLLLMLVLNTSSVKNIITPLIKHFTGLSPLTQGKSGKEVFGFAPYWTFDKLDNVDFSTLTTFSYFGVPINADGSMDETDPGYDTFISDHATQVFQKAHKYGTRVVLTITQMDNATIEEFLSNPVAQTTAIRDVVATVKSRGIDGINVDFEYLGDTGPTYRSAYTSFVTRLTEKMHREVPESKVTVSVYASAAKEPKLYDIHAIATVTDGIFMMAYDFAVAGSDVAMPTAPLYGHKNGTYSYDISTAVADFLAVMPAEKLILGVPYYGYNYAVNSPTVHAETLPYWVDQAATQTYSLAIENDTPDRDGVDKFKTGWDADGQVGYRAYHLEGTDEWRIIFLEDTKSLGMKYDFAKTNNLGGVGIWALGFDDGKPELWALLKDKFGAKFADTRILNKEISSL